VSWEVGFSRDELAKTRKRFLPFADVSPRPKFMRLVAALAAAHKLTSA
jgi:hypothetical protein